MRKILIACALLCAAVANATTTIPSGLINWAAPLSVASGGTGATSASTALTNLGAAPLAGATFTGATGVKLASGSPVFFIDGVAGNSRILYFRSNVSNRWAISASNNAESGSNAGSNLNIGRYDDTGTFIDNPMSITRATGVVTYSAIPVQPTPSTTDNSTNSATTAYVVAKLASPTAIGSTAPSTGAFTTLSATSTVSGTGFTTYLASPPAIGGTTPGTGKFTTLQTTAMSRVKASTTNAQSIPNNAFTAVTTWTTTQNQGSNFVASTGVYTVPVAGDYDVRAGVRFTAATGVIGTQVLIAVAVNGTNVYQSGMAQQNTSGYASQAAGSWLVTCNAGDTITIRAFQNSGAAMTLDGGTGANYVQISQVP